MPDENSYTIKEFITHRLEDVSNKISDMHEDLKEVKKQTTETNGRVSKLEWWRNAVIVAVGAVWAVLLIIFPYWVENERERNKKEIKESIQVVLETLASKVEYEK